MKTGVNYGIIESSKTRVWCVFCNVHIPKANKCIEQHTSGVKHQETLEGMAGNGISYSGNVLYCKPCQRALADSESILDHLVGDNHSNWMATVSALIEDECIVLDTYLSSEKTKEDVYCEACNSNFVCTLQNLNEHINSYNHRCCLVDKLKPLNGIFPVETDDEVWCKICDTYVENTVTDVLDHFDDDEHTDWILNIEDIIDGQDVSIADYLSKEHYQWAVCKKCSLEIPCNYQAIEEHVLSDAHLNN